MTVFHLTLLYTGVVYGHRHSVDMTVCPVQGVGGGTGAIAAGCQNFSAVNGDSSQQDSGNTTPLAFDYETRLFMQLLLPAVRLLEDIKFAVIVCVREQMSRRRCSR